MQVQEIKVFLSRQCKKCILVDNWIHDNPYFNRYVQYNPPKTTVPTLPCLLLNGKRFTGDQVLIKLNEIKHSGGF